MPHLGGDCWTGVRRDIDVTRLPAPDGVAGVHDTTALQVHATADAGITVALISDVIAVHRGAAVAIVTYTRFDARRDDLRLDALVATAAARLAAVAGPGPGAVAGTGQRARHFGRSGSLSGRCPGSRVVDDAATGPGQGAGRRWVQPKRSPP